jgi:dihydroorotase (multifunctional complex type)
VTGDGAIAGGMIVTPDGVRPGTVVLRGGLIAGIAAPGETVAGDIIDAAGCHVLPGLIDIHCHIRAPAYPQRGSVGGETAACAAGGITTVFEMPITDPCCNSPERVALRRDHFAGRAVVDFGLYAAPVDLDAAAVEALAASGIVAFKVFTTPSPPGREREFAGLAWPEAADRLRALRAIARTGLPVTVHAEHAGLLAAAEAAVAGDDPGDARIHGRARPVLAEALAVAEMLTLNIEAGARLHIAHVTSALTVEVLRRFRGTSDFTAETCPHYLRYTEEDVARAGVAARINPPVRSATDRAALWAAIGDGTIGHVTTDHAGFTVAEKAAHAGNFLTAPPGHPGTECMLPALLDAVAAGRISIGDVVRLTAGNAAARFGLPDRGRIAPGAKADIVMVDLVRETAVTETSLLTAAAPVARLSHGERFRGRVIRTLLAGETVWDGTRTLPEPRGRFVKPVRAA